MLAPLLSLLVPSIAHAQEEPAEPMASAEPFDSNGNRVAVVIGLSSYKSLPDPIELDFARSDAALIDRTLREDANFTHVFLLADAEATRERIRELLRTEVAQVAGPNDLFLLYFVGHGMGADLDEPALLAYDSTLEKVNEDGFELAPFAQDLLTFTQSGRTVIVTDAIHRNQLDGVYFFGPAANQWPQLRPNTLLISSSQADSPGKDGAFGTVFADGIAGAADNDGDQNVTAQELSSYLVKRMTPAGQIPVAAGDFSPGMVVSNGVSRKDPTASAATDAPIPEPAQLFPDIDVWSAKFVFRDGAAQTVSCPDQPVKACAPSCYVRNLKAGLCTLGAVIDGEARQGKVPVVFAGKYDCGMRSGSLSCKPPLESASKED